MHAWNSLCVVLICLNYHERLKLPRIFACDGDDSVLVKAIACIVRKNAPDHSSDIISDVQCKNHNMLWVNITHITIAAGTSSSEGINGVEDVRMYTVNPNEGGLCPAVRRDSP